MEEMEEIFSVVEARYVDGYRIWLRFEDGTQGEIDFSDELDGEIFEPLNDLEYFKRFRVMTEGASIEWPNGADFAPEYLYEKLRVTA
jgi:hypothetical protein